MDCEICGSPRARYEIYIEGARLTVCKLCKGDKPAYGFSDVKKHSVKVRMDIPEEEVIENYGEVIAGARMKMGMSIEDVGKKLGISIPYLHKIEKQQLLPDEKTIGKLEKFFRIKLKQKTVVPSTSKTNEKNSLSIADVVEVEDGSRHK